MTVILRFASAPEPMGNGARGAVRRKLFHE